MLYIVFYIVYLCARAVYTVYCYSLSPVFQGLKLVFLMSLIKVVRLFQVVL